jgi:valyl-tRNA synthetase
MTATESILSTQYNPQDTEAKWQKYWHENQVFKANPQQKGEVFSIVIPPPNVTGSLHMGHAFNTALIDTLVRYHRMMGKNTLCLPGTDHASIAVQTIIEKQLKAEGKTRYDLGREEFLKKAWQWRHESGGRIVNQLKRIGLSADWWRERFTLDESLSLAVRSAFVQLYEEELIYRGNYMVNWCPESQSAVSDLEVENQEVNGHLWHFRYPLTDSDDFVEVATTRPETMLGDTAVAVNPDDSRYQSLIGKTVTLPIMRRKIPIIADELVDPAFGTGCVKVTPAHDPNDFEMGKRHNLPFINILHKDGTLNENAGEFAGQDRFVARNQVVQRLEEEGFLVKVEDYLHTVPYSDRGKVPVEPLLSTQWFVKIEPLAQKALQCLEQDNSPHFVPERWRKVYRDWLVKLKDWCISRQLWWGHQIPAWYVVSETNNLISDDTPFIVAQDFPTAQAQAIANYGDQVVLQQDPDVLDTWFSSGLWPFSTMGWPQNSEDLQIYYPNTTLVTGFDIIFFWVARMTMMGGHFTGKMPFRDVYIHGLVRDENGKKMSKSANNGIDPLLLIDKYGADALRYTLIKEVAGAGQDISLQYDRQKDESESVEASRNFANKLWNAARFVLMNLDGKTPTQLGTPNLDRLELSDQWILSRFNRVIQQTKDYLEEYGLGEAAKGLYEFIWGDFCDWYIELVKSRLGKDSEPNSRLVAQQTLAYVLEGILKLLHPFMPHITEEIWHNLTKKQGESLALQSLPEVDELIVYDVQRIKSRSEEDESKLNTTLEKLIEQITLLLDRLPEQVSSFLNTNQKPVIVLAIVFGTLIILQFLLSLLKAIYSFPLLAPSFRLIGLLFAVWFLYKNALFSAPRQELLQKIQEIKKEIIGEEEFDKALELTLGKDKKLNLNKNKIHSLINLQLEENFALIFATIRSIRNLRAEAEIKPGLKVPVILQTENNQEQQVLNNGQSYIVELAKVSELTITDSLLEQPKQAIASVVGTIQVLMPLRGIIDIEALKAKLGKKLGKIETEVKSLTGRLNNPNFIQKAPAEVVQNTKDVLQEAQTQLDILQQRLKLLS